MRQMFWVLVTPVF